MWHLAPPVPGIDDLEARLRYRPLWERGIRGQGITVAVLDTGFHPDPEWSGHIETERDFTGEDRPADAAYHHGTAVAACIHQVAPGARLANFKVLPQHGVPGREIVAEAVRFCIEAFPRYQVLNLSLYFEPEGCRGTAPCLLCEALNDAVQHGITVVAAAGNLGPEPGTITCPGLARQALTVGATWTKQEAAWWNQLSTLKRWWWEDFTGEMGNLYGTSYSAAWTSGGVALLKSAFPESTPEEIKEAVVQSAFPLRHTPETAGMLQCDAALNWLLQPARYQQALQALYFNAGNEAAQRPGTYVADALTLALDFIQNRLLPAAQVEVARKDLKLIQACLLPNGFPEQQRQIRQLLEHLPTA